MLILPLVAFSCGSEDMPGPAEGEEVPYIPEPSVGVAAAGTVSTRAKVDGTWHFPVLQYGLCLEAKQRGPEQTTGGNTAWYRNLGYGNILARRGKNTNLTYSAWEFSLKGRQAARHIGLFRHRGPVTVYGMHPYVKDFDISAPETNFDVYNGIDYMYTGPVEIDPSVGPDLNKTLTFKHAMALIEMRISTTMAGTLYVTGLKMETLDAGGTPVELFRTKGRFNPITGSVTPDAGSATSELRTNRTVAVEYENAGGTSPGYTSLSFVVPRADYTAGTGARLKMTVYFQYRDESGTVQDDEIFGSGSSVTFGLDDIMTGGAAQGFLPGYRYSFPVRVDNFIKYFGYPVVQDWLTDIGEDGAEKIYEIVL